MPGYPKYLNSLLRFCKIFVDAAIIFLRKKDCFFGLSARQLLRFQAASHEADAARKSIEEIEGKFEAVRKMRKELW